MNNIINSKKNNQKKKSKQNAIFDEEKEGSLTVPQLSHHQSSQHQTTSMDPCHPHPNSTKHQKDQSPLSP